MASLTIQKCVKKTPKLNGKAFLEEYRNRDQRLTTGSGSIRKLNAYISDTWP